MCDLRPMQTGDHGRPGSRRHGRERHWRGYDAKQHAHDSERAAMSGEQKEKSVGEEEQGEKDRRQRVGGGCLRAQRTLFESPLPLRSRSARTGQRDPGNFPHGQQHAHLGAWKNRMRSSPTQRCLSATRCCAGGGECTSHRIAAPSWTAAAQRSAAGHDALASSAPPILQTRSILCETGTPARCLGRPVQA